METSVIDHGSGPKCDVKGYESDVLRVICPYKFGKVEVNEVDALENLRPISYARELMRPVYEEIVDAAE